MNVKNLLKVIGLLILFVSHPLSSSSLTEGQKRQIAITGDVIQLFQSQNWTELANRATYPIYLAHAIKAIQNKDDFINRFAFLFDQQGITEIAESDPLNDWSVMGDKGIMFKNGQIWITPEGQLSAINRQSEQLKARVKQLKTQKRELLVLDYSYPSIHAKVHELKSGNTRLSLWIKGSDTENPADFVINHGGRDKKSDYTFTQNGLIIFLQAGDVAKGEHAFIAIEDYLSKTMFYEKVVPADTPDCCGPWGMDYDEQDEQSELTRLRQVMAKMTAAIDLNLDSQNNDLIRKALYANSPIPDTADLVTELVLPNYQVQVYQLGDRKFQLRLCRLENNCATNPDVIIQDTSYGTSEYSLYDLGYTASVLADASHQHYTSYFSIGAAGQSGRTYYTPTKGYYFNGIMRATNTAKFDAQLDDVSSLQTIIATINRRKWENLSAEERALRINKLLASKFCFITC